MSDARKCDRCGEFYDLNDEIVKKNGSQNDFNCIVKARNVWGINSSNYLKRYDLCPRCCKDFKNFMAMDVTLDA